MITASAQIAPAQADITNSARILLTQAAAGNGQKRMHFLHERDQGELAANQRLILFLPSLSCQFNRQTLSRMTRVANSLVM